MAQNNSINYQLEGVRYHPDTQTLSTEAIETLLNALNHMSGSYVAKNGACRGLPFSTLLFSEARHIQINPELSVIVINLFKDGKESQETILGSIDMDVTKIETFDPPLPPYGLKQATSKGLYHVQGAFDQQSFTFKRSLIFFGTKTLERYQLFQSDHSLQVSYDPPLGSGTICKFSKE